MPGGDKRAYEQLKELLLAIAARAPAPCADYMGDKGAGHYVKMVHNGIEYAHMQLIAETYDLLHRGAKIPLINSLKSSPTGTGDGWDLIL